MKGRLTELVFVLDKSGSMGGLESDTIGGFNDMIAKQKIVEGDCRVTTVLFDNRYRLLHDRIDIQAIRPINDRDYVVGGSTALLDAIGLTIHKIGNAQKHTAAAYRAAKVLFIIITDGEENASREYTAKHVRQLIEYQKLRYGWEFIFLGANIDAVQTAVSFGIQADRAQNYHRDSQGVNLNFAAMDRAVHAYRTHESIPEDWNAWIEEDYQKRG